MAQDIEVEAEKEETAEEDKGLKRSPVRSKAEERRRRKKQKLSKASNGGTFVCDEDESGLASEMSALSVVEN